MPCSFRVYIDESGDEGFCFDKGASDWFVLSAFVTHVRSDLQTVRLVDQVREILNKPARTALHCRNLKHEHRLPYIEQIAAARLRAVTVLFHKPSIDEPETFQARQRLHHYATRYLLERVSWLCRDKRPIRDSGDGSAHIIFSNKADMSYEEIREYLRRLHRMRIPWNVQINWDAIKPEQVDTFGHRERMGLQIADAVAYGFYSAVQPRAIVKCC